MPEIVVVYDGDCLLCQEFKRYLALKKQHDVTIVNAREKPELVSKLASDGYDINQGMLLIYDDNVYVGKEAAMQVDRLIEGTTRVDKFFLQMVDNTCIISIIYPIFTFLRKLLFWLQGKSSRIKTDIDDTP